jgi:hypothetical protein
MIQNNKTNLYDTITATFRLEIFRKTNFYRQFRCAITTTSDRERKTGPKKMCCHGSPKQPITMQLNQRTLNYIHQKVKRKKTIV